jgi:hypothetical protein
MHLPYKEKFYFAFYGINFFHTHDVQNDPPQIETEENILRRRSTYGMDIELKTASPNICQ